MESVVLIGYSGHGYVVADILRRHGCNIVGYMDTNAKPINPFNLQYLGSENDPTASIVLASTKFTIAIGDNLLRAKIFQKLTAGCFSSFDVIHPACIIAGNVNYGMGLTIMAGAIINPLAQLGNGVIINTNATVEHECNIGNFVHIAPGAVLAGNVTVGENSFIGAGAVVKQGLTIGKNVIIGAGSVVLRNIPDHSVAYGNPAKIK